MILRINNSLCSYKCNKCKAILVGLPRHAKGKGMVVAPWMESCIRGSLELAKEKIGCTALYLTEND